MMKTITSKTFENARDGLMDGLKSGADFALERSRRVEFRKPWVYRKPVGTFLGMRPWVLGTIALSAAVAVVAGILYSRKRRQIADRYSPGADDAAEHSINGHQVRDEHLASATP